MEDRYLFRAKRIDTGEWIIGSLLVDKQQDIEAGEQIEIIGIYPSEYKDFAKKVDPSTVCQCTGLKDKNGKLIWENDIVKINNSKVNTVIASGMWCYRRRCEQCRKAGLVPDSRTSGEKRRTSN